jgi:UDP:flavonoid glycosyltransferase YjiC (YdhE family)
MEKRKFVLAPMGSAGDVHPLLWVGKLLAARGHDVVMAVQEMMRDVPERAGLRTVAWGNPADQEALLRNPDLWHPKRAFDLITAHAAQWAEELRPVVESEIDPGRTIILAGALSYGARLAAERTGTPVLTAHLQPSIFMSVEDAPVMMAGMEWLPRSPRWMRGAFFRVGNWIVDRKIGPAVIKLRTAAALPVERTLRGVMRTYWHSPHGVVCLFPDWFARRAADWPDNTIHTRFPLYDEADERGVDPRLEAFLAAGDKPVAITPGSANAHGQRFLREAVAACALLKKRPLVITRFPETAGTLPPDGAVFEYLPFGQVFPRAAAVIHHGGIGTMSQCFAAGVPQLVMPMAHDQPDNAFRMKQRLGVGDYLYPKKFTAPRIARTLERLLGDPAVRAACAGVKGHMEAQMPPDAVAALIESLSEKLLAPRGQPEMAATAG